ncbi:hypothetical protein ACIBI9_04085 [Nonomuraea sp. NPDC050451]|uniref:hypothetical protein n=1 Tax=Nonomuraea sp. NPDC050451 TaxID=3364364 RepID=UPI0037BA6EA0
MTTTNGLVPDAPEPDAPDVIIGHITIPRELDHFYFADPRPASDAVDLRDVLAELDAFRVRVVRQLDAIQARLAAVIAEQVEQAEAVKE